MKVPFSKSVNKYFYEIYTCYDIDVKRCCNHSKVKYSNFKSFASECPKLKILNLHAVYYARCKKYWKLKSHKKLMLNSSSAQKYP